MYVYMNPLYGHLLLSPTSTYISTPFTPFFLSSSFHSPQNTLSEKKTRKQLDSRVKTQNHEYNRDTTSLGLSRNSL